MFLVFYFSIIVTIINALSSLNTRISFDNSSKEFQFRLGAYDFHIDYISIFKYFLLVIIIIVPIFFYLFCLVDIDTNSFVFSNPNPSSTPSGQESSNSTPQTDSENTPNQGQPNGQGNGQPNSEAPGQPNGEDNGTQDNDSGIGSSDSSSGIGSCTCCDQDQDHEGPCVCSNDCDPQVTTHYEEPVTGTCCGCGTHSYSHACTDCACNYCPDCYNTRQN